jgi:hypothetical protein
MKFQSREHGTGQYTFDGGLERLCVCGHSLGIHAAERVKTKDGKKYQDCFVDTFSMDAVKNSTDPFYQEVYRHMLTGKTCDCVLYKPSRKA